MKLYKLFMLLLLAASVDSCSRDLPSYSDIHPFQPPKAEEKEEPKEDNTPTGPALGYDVSPVGENAYIDGNIELEFKSVPTLGNEGYIKIYTSDGTEADVINMADVLATPEKMADNTLLTTCHDILGARNLDRKRVVNYKPVRIDGNKVIIKPHSNRLEYEKTYYITIDATVFTAEGFKGVAAKEWEFKTAKAPASKSEITVSRSGNADFRTIQGALDWAYTCGGNNAMTINIKNGVYQEQLFARYNNKVTFKGESREGTILQYTNS